ncbi:MAG: glycosyltransferase, partial [Puniceicoccaceae bacterium]
CENQSWLQDLKMRSQQLQKGGPIQSIEWLPMVRDAVKWGLLQASEAFILPSHQENFGIVVAESLACGTPVLLSDKVNVWEEASTGGAGFVATDDLDGTASLLRQWLALDAEQRQQRRSAARA